MSCTVDWSDACARAKALTDAYYGIVAGGSETLIRHRTEQGEREVRFGAHNLDVLRSEMRAAEDACRATQGLPPINRRFAITAGARRPPFQGR